MIIVAGSSPFVVLVSIEHVDVFATIFQVVIIPPEVRAARRDPHTMSLAGVEWVQNGGNAQKST